MLRELLRLAAQNAVAAARARLLRTDPKVLTSTVASGVTWAAINLLHIDVGSPAFEVLDPIVVAAIVGFLTPNAASHLDNRWSKP